MGLGSRALNKPGKPKSQAPLQTGRGFFIGVPANRQNKWSSEMKNKHIAIVGATGAPRGSE